MEIENLNNISQKINDLGGKSTTEFAGGGIVCIIVDLGDYTFWWGTANETWGADVYFGDEFQDGKSINTGLSIEELDIEIVAITILKESRLFLEALR